MTCPVCENLRAGIAAAQNAKDYERARVLQVLLDGHRRQTCAEAQAQREQAAAVVEWRSGQRWVTR